MPIVASEKRATPGFARFFLRPYFDHVPYGFARVGSIIIRALRNFYK